jgi:hypothetical protein
VAKVAIFAPFGKVPLFMNSLVAKRAAAINDDKVKLCHVIWLCQYEHNN